MPKNGRPVGLNLTSANHLFSGTAKEEGLMSVDEIRARIKDAIAKVSKIDPQTIGDDASYHDDLGLDSLSILETIVEVQCRFQIPDLPDNDYAAIRTVEDTVQFVQQYLRLKVA
jgi:NADH dehydrogenase (ubiquinone) 1 alpha/beta subcomplex 1